MEEQLITFETAKLAREKGFDIPYRIDKGKYFINLEVLSAPVIYGIGSEHV